MRRTTFKHSAIVTALVRLRDASEQEIDDYMAERLWARLERGKRPVNLDAGTQGRRVGGKWRSRLRQPMLEIPAYPRGKEQDMTTRLVFPPPPPIVPQQPPALVPTSGRPAVLVDRHGVRQHIHVHDDWYLETKRRFKERLAETHPDKKGGNAVQFRAVHDRYDRWLDEQKEWYAQFNLAPPVPKERAHVA
jgi:hypothetical protein